MTDEIQNTKKQGKVEDKPEYPNFEEMGYTDIIAYVDKEAKKRLNLIC